ncbi:MAG: aldo/keto reductase, partial [Mesorhizobium sp.]
MTNESVIGRRIFLGAAATLAAAPILASASSRASAQTGNASGSAAVPSSDRRKLGTLEVSSVGLGVQNMHRTYQTTIPSRPEMINIIRTAHE